MSSQPEAQPNASTPSTEDDGSEHYAAYEEHAKTLRTWLVAYGIGGPVLIISQDAVWKRLSESGALREIAACFLGGVGLQVILAAVNKSAMWACYFGEIDPKYRSTIRYSFGVWLSEQYAIDFVCDVVAMALFGWATYRCFTSLIQ